MNLTAFVIARELKTAPRRKRYYLKRMSIVGLLGAVMLIAAHFGREMGSTTIGLEIFRTLSFASLGGLSFVAMASAVNLIVREKEERTLGLLLLTEVSGWNIVFGKLFTALFGATMTLLSVLPLILLAVSLGGVSTLQVLVSIALILAHAALVCALGLLAACMTRNERSAGGTAGLFWIFTFLIFPILLAIVMQKIDQEFGWQPPQTLVFAISPFMAMGQLVGTGEWVSALLNAGLSVLVSIPVIVWAQVAILRGANTSSNRVARSVQRRMEARREANRRVRKPLGASNPVFWRDYEIWLGGNRGTWLKYGLSMCALLIMFVWFALAVKTSLKDFLDGLLVLGIVSSSAILALGGVALSSQAFNKEKQYRALEPLLTTDLNEREILWGKVGAIAKGTLPWALSSVVFGLLCIIRYGDEHDFWNVAAIAVVEYVAMLFGYAWLAFWFSLRYRRNIGFGLALLVLILWNSFGRMFVALVMRAYSNAESVVAIDALFHFGMGGICMSLCFANFRARALSAES